MPANPDSLVLRVIQVDALGNSPWDEPVDVVADGFKIAAVYLVEPGEDDKLVGFWRDGDDLRLRDVNNPGTAGSGFTLTELLASSGGGITELQHEALDTLVHALTETHDTLITRDANGRISVVLAEDASDADIRKTEILTRTTNGKVATYRETQYEADGSTVKRQLDHTVHRLTSGRVDHIETVRTL